MTDSSPDLPPDAEAGSSEGAPAAGSGSSGGAGGAEPSGVPPVARTEGEREAARLRYELSRLRDRRPVRAALAVTSWKRGGRAAALAALRGRPPRWDAAGPDQVPARPRYPHLRVAHLAADPVVGGVVPTLRVTPVNLVGIRRDRVDVLLVDDLAGWDAGALGDACDAARAAGAAVVTLGVEAAAAVRGAGHRPDLTIRSVRVQDGAPAGGSAHADGTGRPSPAERVQDGAPAGGSAHGGGEPTWWPAVDPRRHRPVGADPAVVDGRGLDLAAWLAVAATGTIPVAPATDALRQLTDGLADAALTDDAAEVPARIAALEADAEARDRLLVRLRRHVLTEQGRANRVDALVAALGLCDPPDQTIGILLATRRPDRLPGIVADLARQTHAALHLVVAVHGDGPVPDRLDRAPDVVVRVPSERPLGTVLNAALDETAAPLLAKIDDDDRYGRHHLADLVLALDYSGAEVVGKRRHAVLTVDDTGQPAQLALPAGPAEERFEDHLPGATMLVHGDVLRALRWRLVPNGVDTELVRAVHLAGGSCYSTHRFGFARLRHGDHTFAGDSSLQGSALDPADLTGYLDV